MGSRGGETRSQVTRGSGEEQSDPTSPEGTREGTNMVPLPAVPEETGVRQRKAQPDTRVLERESSLIATPSAGVQTSTTVPMASLVDIRLVRS